MQKILEFIARLRERYNGRMLLLAFAVFWVPVIVFAKLAGEILENEPLSFDVAILRWLHAHASPWLDHLFLGATYMGSAIGVISLTALGIGLLLYRNLHRSAALLFAGVAGAAAANVVLKLLFHRARPSLWDSLVVEHSYSFPSGHAMASSALAASIVVICWSTKWRWVAGVVAGLYMVLVGLSRLYLGVHYPTDVLAGWCVSIAWVAIVATVVRYYTRPFGKLLRRV